MSKSEKELALEAYVAKLEARNAALVESQKRGGNLTLKVSEKGAVSLYGMGKWPVTLYQEQWAKVLDHGDVIREFISANKHRLTAKADKLSPKAAMVEELVQE